MQGLRKEYYLDGTLRFMERYERGFLHGTRIIYNKHGRIYRKEMYVRGMIADWKFLTIINSRDLTAEDILKIENAELRRTCLEEFSYERFLAALSHDVLDKEGEYNL